MRFPSELWSAEEDRLLAQSIAEAFLDHAIILTDGLTNSVFLNESAERFFGERAEALVNRVAASLAGYGERESAPAAFNAALLGEAPPWRGMISPASPGGPLYFAEASALRRGDELLCGILRITLQAQARP